MLVRYRATRPTKDSSSLARLLEQRQAGSERDSAPRLVMATAHAASIIRLQAGSLPSDGREDLGMYVFVPGMYRTMLVAVDRII